MQYREEMYWSCLFSDEVSFKYCSADNNEVSKSSNEVQWSVKLFLNLFPLNLFPFLSQVKNSKLQASIPSALVSGCATLQGKLSLNIVCSRWQKLSAFCTNIKWFWPMPSKICLLLKCIVITNPCSFIFYKLPVPFKTVSSKGESFTAHDQKLKVQEKP